MFVSLLGQLCPHEMTRRALSPGAYGARIGTFADTIADLMRCTGLLKELLECSTLINDDASLPNIPIYLVRFEFFLCVVQNSKSILAASRCSNQHFSMRDGK